MASSRALSFGRQHGRFAGALASQLQGCRAFSSRSEDGEARQYLQDTVIPMLYFQSVLPRLPIPKLRKSCNRYLDAQKPLLTPTEYDMHKGLVEQFYEGPGKVLNKILVQHNDIHSDTSYIAGYWYDMYLKQRMPLVLNSNPFMTFTDDTHPGFDDQACRAASLVSSAVRFMKTFRSKKLEPDLYHLNPKATDNDKIKRRLKWFPHFLAWYGAYLHKIFPLDMSQYYRLFNSTRIPQQDVDKLFTDSSARHLVVLRNGHFYSFNILREDKSVVHPNEIYRCIKYILSDDSSANMNGIASLTSEERDTWAAARVKLEETPENAEVLKLIDSAAFMLCLDDSEPKSVDELIRVFLHGESHNRWFDKSIQLIVCKGGKAAVNFEHAWGDGVAVLRFMNEVYRDVKENPFTPPTDLSGENKVQKLEFVVDEPVKEAIVEAREKFAKSTSSLSMETLQYHGMNRDFLKEKKVGADALFQLALQMAFHRHLGFVPATYESCSTAAFRHGRTETVRPATMETKKCVEAFEKSNPAGVEEMKGLMDAAVQKHNQLIKEAAMGQGFDRHLFALSKLAGPAGTTLFNSAPYKKINHIHLSTSTLSSPAVLLGGFGPVVADGFGVGYRADKEYLGAQVTSYPARNSREFAQALEGSFKDLQAVIEGRNFKI